MFIQTEETPNPSTLKFLPGREVLPDGSIDYKSAGEASNSPLAQALFDVDGVVGVFLSDDFITITKRDDKQWQLMKPGLLGVIMEHFTANRPVVLSNAESDIGSGINEDDDEIVSQIKELPRVSKVRSARLSVNSTLSILQKTKFNSFWMKNDFSDDSEVWIFPSTKVLDLSERSNYEFLK